MESSKYDSLHTMPESAWKFQFPVKRRRARNFRTTFCILDWWAGKESIRIFHVEHDGTDIVGDRAKKYAQFYEKLRHRWRFKIAKTTLSIPRAIRYWSWNFWGANVIWRQKFCRGFLFSFFCLDFERILTFLIKNCKKINRKQLTSCTKLIQSLLRLNIFQLYKKSEEVWERVTRLQVVLSGSAY